MFSVRTDLAVEARELINEESIDGVEIYSEEDDGISTTVVHILNETGSKVMGKPCGSYITMESQAILDNDVSTQEKIIKNLSQHLTKLMGKRKKNDTILVVGLGNWNITPDALGPKVVGKILVTRHLTGMLPKELEGGVSSVAAVAPGVMGITGIETSEIIKGITEKLKPSCLIVIDALAARKTSRMNTTVQLTDTGISPGAGIGNRRAELSEKTMGIPVIAVGIPTVVDAATLVNDSFERVLTELEEQTSVDTKVSDVIGKMDPERKYQLIQEFLDTENMFVTPKEVDAVIDRLSVMIAASLNVALHPGISQDDMKRYLS
ncbi:MAG: GPR endopeptidase [Clostridiales bacterium]|nr:GPR endopeptidase [Clostridiales bacterium]